MTLLDRVSTWTDVCSVDDLHLDRGVAAFVHGYQVAIFRVSPDGALYAVSNYDPFSGAYVLSRGIVGSKGDTPKVSSPIFKQSFDLHSGQCLDDPSISVMTFPARTADGRIEVGTP